MSWTGNQSSGGDQYAKTYDFKVIINMHYARILAVTTTVPSSQDQAFGIETAFAFSVAAFEEALSPYIDEEYNNDFKKSLEERSIDKKDTSKAVYRLCQLGVISRLLDRKGLLLEKVVVETL